MGFYSNRDVSYDFLFVGGPDHDAFEYQRSVFRKSFSCLTSPKKRSLGSGTEEDEQRKKSKLLTGQVVF